MMVDRQPWFYKWYRHIRRESAFLPKRLVGITSLLFALYVALLLRAEFSGRPFGIGLVDVILQSKLIADYEQIAGPSAPFAPLQLAIIEAKIWDENPYLSEEDVASLVQAAITAANAPIVTATPTPHLYTQAVLKAAIVVSGSLAMGKPVATVTPAWTSGGVTVESVSANGVIANISTTLPPALSLRDQRSNGVNGVGVNPVAQVHPVNTPLTLSTGTVAQPLQPSIEQGALMPPSDASHSVLEESSPDQTMDTVFVPVIASVIAPMIPLGIATTVALATEAVTQEATLPSTIATDTVIAVLSMPSQPISADTMMPTPFADSSAVVAATPTSWPTPTSTPFPTWTPTLINTPTATWTTTSVVGVIPTSTVTPTITVAVTPTATGTPTSTSIAFAPVATTDPLIGIATLTSTPTTTSSATTSPTMSPTATPTVSAPTTIINLTAHVENDKVYLAWPDNSVAGVVGYHLYRSTITALGIGERVNPTLLSAPSYIDTVILDGSQYAYVATAVNQWNLESLPGPAVTVTVADQVAPRTPTQFSASLNGSQIQLWWRANEEPDLAGYNVYRSNRLPIDKTGGPINGATLLVTSSYLDMIVLDGQTYYYSFTAVDRTGNESLPSIETQMPTIDLVAPTAPTGLKITLQGATALVQWQANPEADIMGYRLYRSAALPVDLSMAPLHSEPLLTTLHYADQTIQEGNLYYYVLVAVDMSQNRSAPSAAVVLSVLK